MLMHNIMYVVILTALTLGSLAPGGSKPINNSDGGPLVPTAQTDYNNGPPSWH